jgi:hypothetical protein
MLEPRVDRALLAPTAGKAAIDSSSLLIKS